MGSAASRVRGSSSPTVSLSDICQRMRCLVACCGSEVHIELKDQLRRRKFKRRRKKKKNADPKSDEPTITETVL